jgi:dTDP-4-dehydrorhamnose reductase
MTEKILITGASGYLGARLYLDLAHKYDVIGTYHSDKLSPKFVHMDVTNEEEVQDVVLKHRPNLIIHTAANASAKWCEANAEKAVLLNDTGTKNVAEAANSVQAKLFYISSFAAESPSDLYAITKKSGEDYAKQVKAGHNIIKPSLIIGGRNKA